MVVGDFFSRRLGEGGGEAMVIESGLPRGGERIDEDELFGTAAQIVAIPEFCVVDEPGGDDLGFVDADGRCIAGAAGLSGRVASKGCRQDAYEYVSMAPARAHVRVL